MCAAIVAGLDAAPIFDFAEHILNFVALAIEHRVVGDHDLTVSL